MNIDISQLREHLKNFHFQKLFVESLGWENPKGSTLGDIKIKGHSIPYTKISEISEIPVLKFNRQAFENYNNDFKKFHKEINKQYTKNLLLFSDEHSFCTLSYFSKEEQVRPHSYFKDRNDEYFISKLASIHFGIEDESKIKEIGDKLEQAFDTEKVTKKFYNDFKNNHFNFTEYISGLKPEEKKWYASLILNRLMFIWFLQKKGFVNSDFNYLQNKLEESKRRGKDRYYQEFLTLLFFEGFAKKPIERSQKAKDLLGNIKYLNGGLFVPHTIEEKYEIKQNSEIYTTKIKIHNKAFEETFNIFNKYDWHLEGKQGKSDNEISPDVMGYIFEKYINELQQKSLGAYYTKDEITGYLSRNAIQKSVLEKAGKKGYKFKTIADLLHKLNTPLCKQLLTNDDSILNTLTVLDPAVGSGAFLTAAMKELINIYSPIIGKIETSGDRDLKKWLKDFKEEHKSIPYGIKKNIILKNLYGVDIMKEAVEVCKLRLFLSLVSSALNKEELEPLPNMDFNIMCGNSLIGFLRESEEEQETQKSWSEVLGEDYSQIQSKYNRLVSKYKNQPLSFIKLKELKRKTNQFLDENSQKLSRTLADKCNKKGVKYPEILDIQGKKKITNKRPVKPEDFYSKEGERNLNPFHWDFAFNEIMEKGGFDVIITNPPWERVQMEEKEFFQKYDSTIQKKKTKKSVLDIKKETLLKDKAIKKGFLHQKSAYDFQSIYFYKFYQYQSGKVELSGQFVKDSSTIDTYRLFIERCFVLLNTGSFLGIVLPGGVHKDDGAISLRKKLLFNKVKIDSLIDFQNQMGKGKGKIFEGVHSSYPFLLLNLQKAKPKEEEDFPTQFHSRDLKVLEHFQGHRSRKSSQQNSKQSTKISKTEGEGTNIIHRESEVVWQSIKEIKTLSPRDYSIIEFKNSKDKGILKKADNSPTLNEKSQAWNLSICQGEFRETINPHLFKNEQKNTKHFPLYKGGAIWQYNAHFNTDKSNRYIDICSPEIQKQKLYKDGRYKKYRLVVRAISGNTNERTLVSAIIPKNSFITNTLNEIRINESKYKLLMLSFFNSFVVDYFLRLRISASVNPKYLIPLRIPRLKENNPNFKKLVERSAKLTCIGKEFNELADEMGIPRGGVTNQQERWRIQGEIDAIVAYVYGLTREEFDYVLSTFTTGKNQERLKALKNEALKAFKNNNFLPKAG